MSFLFSEGNNAILHTRGCHKRDNNAAAPVKRDLHPGTRYLDLSKPFVLPPARVQEKEVEYPLSSGNNAMYITYEGHHKRDNTAAAVKKAGYILVP